MGRVLLLFYSRTMIGILAYSVGSSVELDDTTMFAIIVVAAGAVGYFGERVEGTKTAWDPSFFLAGRVAGDFLAAQRCRGRMQ
jgi:hypothetical protein